MTSLLLGSESDTSSSDSEKQSPVKKKRRRGGDIDGLKINEDYAKAYNHFREKGNDNVAVSASSNRRH